MHMVLCYTNGRRDEGVLLAASPGRMRVAVRRLTDTLELRAIEGQWYADDGELVEIDSWISDGSTEAIELFADFFPRVSRACN